MIVLTVNAGSHSLHLSYVDGDQVRDQRDPSALPGSAATERAVDEFLANKVPPRLGGAPARPRRGHDPRADGRWTLWWGQLTEL